MAGWDHDFTVDLRDLDLLRGCFRVWRRTCARYYVEFTYYRDRAFNEQHGRRRYVLVYNLASANAPLAVAEFAAEMRAVSTVQEGRRRQRLPLRLLREVAWVNVPESIGEQIDAKLVPDQAREQVAGILERYQTAFSAYERRQISPADILESQHSVVTDLALVLGDGARTSDHYPELIKKLTSDLALQDGLSKIGSWRNRVKHRGEYGLAERVIDEGVQLIWTMAARLTGAYVDPVSEELRRIVADPAYAFKLPSMFSRFGEPRRPVR